VLPTLFETSDTIPKFRKAGERGTDVARDTFRQAAAGLRVNGLLAGQTCLVTGAGQGLGLGISSSMAAEGAHAVLIDRKPDSVATATEAIRATGGSAEGHVLDVTDAACFAALVADIAARRRIDVLVNNAGINPPPRTILEDTQADWDRTIAVNLEAVWRGSKLVAPHMVAARGGRIIHIASVQGFVSSGQCGSYNAAKAGVIGLTASMAVELAPHGILVNAVAPGFLRTPMSVIDGVDETETPEFHDWYVGRGRIPLRRAGEPEDVAGTVVFLASRLCRWMTGQVLVVDGGMTATF
jgi:NAD(P)-dependent dehydrogenase (short-subunit alcohol dehydrogenase family)